MPTNSARLAQPEEAERPVVEFIAARDLAECLAIFEAAEVTAAPIYDIDQFVADPHVKEREILVDLPDADLGSRHRPQRHPAPLRDARRPAPAAPTLGEHTAEVLARVGVDGADLAELKAERIV